jgi:putative transferase (TIGR04331 family)
MKTIEQKILFISSEESLNCINLFPKFEMECAYGFKFNEYKKLTALITEFSNNISTFLSNTFFLKIDATAETKYRFIRPYVGALSYILLDRYLRLLKIQNHFKNNILEGVNITQEFMICKDRNILEAYARDNATFNQYIINNLLSVKSNDIKSLKYLDTNNWDFYKGFNSVVNKIQNLNLKPFENEKNKHKIIVTRLAYIHGTLRENYQDFILLNEVMDINQNINTLEYNYNEREVIKKGIKDFFYKEIDKVAKTLNIENEYLPSINRSLLNLFFDLYPMSGLEGSFPYFSEAKNIIHYLEPRAYIEGFLSFIFEDAIYLNAACHYLNIPVYGVQHSGRGGYIANCAYVSEYSQNCADFYITSGWKHIEKHLPYPKNGLIPLPSINFSLKKDKYKYSEQKQILLCLGEIFPYPLIYDGSYMVDTRHIWYKTMMNLINKLLEYEYKIVIRSYCELSHDTHKKLLDDVELLKSEKIIISRDFRKGVAKEYFDNSVLVIWDILSGGFIESVLYEIPTIVIASEQQVAYQNEAMGIIEKLKSINLIMENEKSLDSILSSINKDFYTQEKKTVLQEFLNNFVSISPSWEKEWFNFFQKLLHRDN